VREIACVPKDSGGEGGIRTHGTVSRTLAFEASTFNRSVTSPQRFSCPILTDGPYAQQFTSCTEVFLRESAAGGEEGLQKSGAFGGKNAGDGFHLVIEARVREDFEAGADGAPARVVRTID
jgi:hypothetical protein